MSETIRCNACHRDMPKEKIRKNRIGNFCIDVVDCLRIHVQPEVVARRSVKELNCKITALRELVKRAEPAVEYCRDHLLRNEPINSRKWLKDAKELI